MSVMMNELDGGKILEVHVADRLTDADFQEFVPRFERLLKQHGKLRVLFNMTQFHGWDARGLWDDLKFDQKHYNDIERIAMIGEKKWQEWMAKLCKPFTSAEVRYYDFSESNDALLWLQNP